MAKTHSRKKVLKKIKIDKGPHKSFRRTYREDYRRETNIPGMLQHIVKTFKILGKNWKTFALLIVVAVVLNALMIGLMSGETYMKINDTIEQSSTGMAGGDVGGMMKAWMILVATITTGGLAGESDVARVCGVLIFLVLWLTTIYLIRHKKAGHKVNLRDGLYNSMTPLISTFVVLAVAIVQCVPIILLIIAYSAAVQTEFLATPFYALMFLAFAVAMIAISGYLLSSTLIALVAVTAPGLYPVKAMRAASDVMMGRRMGCVARLIALIITLGVVWAVVMLPIILVDLGMKNFEWAQGIPVVPVCLNIMTCFSVVYSAAYLYIYYRWLLDEKD